jgi:predicted dehydrogenase
MNQVYKVGIIGYGGFGQFLHHHWQQLEEIEISAISDVYKLPDQQGIHNYENWQDLVQDPDLDIVAVCTPPANHAEMACAALQNGKHVIIEKPIAITLVEAQKIVDISKIVNSYLCVDYMLRFNPIIEALIGISREKIFGELRHASVQNFAQDSSLPVSHWFWDKSISGGIFIEHAVHFIDLINYFSESKCIRVNGQSSWRNPDQEDQVLLSMLYENGMTATHYHSFTRPGFFEQNLIKFVYDLAEIELTGWIPLSGKIRALVNPSSMNKLSLLPGFKIHKQVPITKMQDDSRPEGWGDYKGAGQVVRSRGKEYSVETLITGQIGLSQTKGQVYGQCVQLVLLDLIQKIEHPDHILRISMEDAIKSLDIAIQADKIANSKS